MLKTNIAITFLIVIMIFSTAALCTQFGGSPARPESEKLAAEEEGQREESKSLVEPVEDIKEDIRYQIAYLEIGISEDSKHFEHRVANIFSAAPDGSGGKLIYSDIGSKYELGWIYGISPDGKKISCGFFEGGRGAYSSLSIIDISAGSVEELIEFDYTESENFEMLASIYEKPVWSNDSRSIAYEIISYPFTDGFSDGGIFIVDIQTKETAGISLDIKDGAIRSSMFLYPVLFTAGDKKLFNILHTYGSEEESGPAGEDGPVQDFVPRNEKLEIVDTAGGEINTVIDVNELISGNAELGSFSAARSVDKLVFDIQDISRGNGDIWISGLDGSSAARLTDTPETIEMQASVADVPSSMPMVAYTAIENSPDMQEQFIGGDIYYMGLDGSENTKITDYGTGAASPIFSPDGRYIAFIHYILSENMDYIASTQIEVFDIETGETMVAASGSGIISLAGWVADE